MTRRPRRLLARIWPHGVLGVALIVSGAVNVIIGVTESLHRIGALRQLGALPAGEISMLAQPLSAVGGTAQAVLGAILIVIGVGLFWRLRAAWAFAVLMLAAAVAVSAARHRFEIGFALPTATLVLLIIMRNGFVRRTALAGTLIALVSVVATVAYGTFGAFVLGAGFRPPITDLATGLYFTFVTLSTVGYGDIVAVSTDARIFVITLIVGGLSVFATAVASTLGPLISGELSSVLGGKETKLEAIDHVILLGHGTFAVATAHELARRGASFVQVVAPDARAPLPDKPVVTRTHGHESALRSAGIARARTVIVADDDDGTNAVVTLLVKHLNAGVTVLALANSRDAMRALELARADVVFAPALAGGRLIADLAEGVAIPQQFADLLQRS